MIGALTQTLSVHYRRFAQSLDSVASLLLVLAGEVLAGAGLGGGRFLLSVPASELQSRRDAVLLALRNLAGTTQQAYGNDQWPWGLHGFRQVLQLIERAVISTSARCSRAGARQADGRADRARRAAERLGLRALGATADVAVQRLHRLRQRRRQQCRAAFAAGALPFSRRSSFSWTLCREPQRLSAPFRGARRSASTGSPASAARTPQPAACSRLVMGTRPPGRTLGLLSRLRVLRRRRHLPNRARQAPLRHRPGDRLLHARLDTSGNGEPERRARGLWQPDNGVPTTG